MQFKQMTLTTTIIGPSWSLYNMSDTNSTNHHKCTDCL